jgi:hypothetical protein
MMMFNNKKAQITVFIILGILLLFGSSLTIYIKSKVTQSTDFDEIIGTTSTEIRPVKEFVEQCMHDLGKEAIILVGENGGYVEKDTSIVTSIPFEPTIAEGIEIADGTDIVIPYWFYMEGPNSCQTLSKDCRFVSGLIDQGGLIPPLTKNSISDLSIENQISDYVETNLPNCLDGFNVLSKVGYKVISDNEPLVDTVITNGKKVSIKLKLPLIITQSNRETSIDYFVTKINVDLKNVYFLSLLLVKQEQDHVFLEQMLGNLISSFGGVDSSIPPQFGGVDMDSGSEMKTWNEIEVKKEMQTFLGSHVNKLKVTNTRSMLRMPAFSENEEIWDYTIKKLNYLIDIDTDYLFNLDVKFMYLPNWPIYLDITPGIGPLIMPDSGDSSLLSYLGFGFTRYDFMYDVSFPVVVKITDTNAFEGEGFSFYFAMEANYRNNKPLILQNPDNHTEEKSSSSAIVPSLLCQESGKDTGNITINTFDFLMRKPLKNVKIYSSFSKKECVDGITMMGEDKNIYTGQFQKGIGYLNLKKPNFLPYDLAYVFGINKTDNLSIYMYAKQEMNITLVKKTISKVQGWTTSNLIKKLKGEDMAILSLERVKDKVSKEIIKETIIFSKDNLVKKIKLYPGKYKYSIAYLNSDNYTVPEGETCQPPSMPWEEESCDIIEAMSLPLTSMIEIDEKDENYLLDLNENMFYGKENIEFRMIVPNFYEEQALLEHDDLNMLELMETYFKRDYIKFKPKIT